MNKTWILIADGARAKVYQNNGPGTGLRETRFPEMLGVNEQPQDINADRAGSNRNSGGGGAHRMNHSSDPQREQKRVFAKDIADFLKIQEQDNAFDELVIVAPAKTLGDLREVLDKSVASHVKMEVAKDLTQFSVQELPKHLEDVVRL
jgi:protein required for attachment to host cells